MSLGGNQLRDVIRRPDVVRSTVMRVWLILRGKASRLARHSGANDQWRQFFPLSRHSFDGRDPLPRLWPLNVSLGYRPLHQPGGIHDSHTRANLMHNFTSCMRCRSTNARNRANRVLGASTGGSCVRLSPRPRPALGYIAGIEVSTFFPTRMVRDVAPELSPGSSCRHARHPLH